MPRPSTYAPESPDYLIIDEDRTSNDIGIWVDTPPMPPMAEQVYREINIPGREETLDVIENSYKDINLPVKAYIFNKEYDPTIVYAWIRDAKKLRFNTSNYYYRIKRVLPPTLNYQGNGKTMITLNFVVAPFRYFKNDQLIENTETTFTVENTGNIYCRPIYKIYGNGYLTLTVNDNGYYSHEDATIIVRNVHDYVIIDAERLMVYRGSDSQSVISGQTWNDVLNNNPEWTNLLDIAWGMLRNQPTIEVVESEGKIPLLAVGTSTIRITGSNFTKIEILRNQRVV